MVASGIILGAKGYVTIASGIYFRHQKTCDDSVRDFRSVAKRRDDSVRDFWVVAKRRVTGASGIFKVWRQKKCDDSVRDWASAEGEPCKKILLD